MSASLPLCGNVAVAISDSRLTKDPRIGPAKEFRGGWCRAWTTRDHRECYGASSRKGGYCRPNPADTQHGGAPPVVLASPDPARGPHASAVSDVVRGSHSPCESVVHCGSASHGRRNRKANARPHAPSAPDAALQPSDRARVRVLGEGAGHPAYAASLSRAPDYPDLAAAVGWKSAQSAQ